MLLTRVPEGGWDLGGHVNTNAELVSAAPAQIAELIAASPAPQLERAWDAWQGERYRRGEIGQRPAGTGNPFRLC